jgi:hypothetical protein
LTRTARAKNLRKLVAYFEELEAERKSCHFELMWMSAKEKSGVDDLMIEWRKHPKGQEVPVEV